MIGHGLGYALYEGGRHTHSHSQSGLHTQGTWCRVAKTQGAVLIQVKGAPQAFYSPFSCTSSRSRQLCMQRTILTTPE